MSVRPRPRNRQPDEFIRLLPGHPWDRLFYRFCFADRIRVPGHRSQRMAIPVSRRLDFSEIPVIDVAPLIEGDAARAGRAVAALGKACSDIGFIYVRNHGVPRDLVARMED